MTPNNNIDLKVEHLMNSLVVIKRDGITEQPFTAEKIHKPLFWSTKGVDGVNVSDIEMKLSVALTGKTRITTHELHEELITATVACISSETPNYDIVAGRLVIYQIRKEAYGQYEPPHIKHILKTGIEAGRYDPELITYYSDEEWDAINSMIDHSRDYLFRYAGTEQMREKYLVKNRLTGKIFEGLQVPYILAPAVAFSTYPKEERLHWIKEFYDAASQHFISLPTPIMGGVRTKVRQYSSCVVLDSGDTLDTIGYANFVSKKYVAKRAGLGINVGRNRGIGSDIGDGEIKHTGTIPFIKDLTASMKSCSKGGIRDGAGTFFFPMWHYEYPELVVLKDNSLTEEATCKSADYCVQINRYLLQRFIKNENITLFSPGEKETPGLYESFFDKDQSKFAELYEKYEKDPTIRKRVFPAHKLFTDLAIQRSSTGRIYIMFADTVNQHSSFKSKIYQSNLCVSGDTAILTDKGQIPIIDTVGTEVNVWNGEEWSRVIPRKTGENQKLLKVEFSDGTPFKATPYHKFYVQKGYLRGTGVNSYAVIEKRTHELEPGDRLIKFDLPAPVDNGYPDFPYAYTHGVFCGDGTYESDNKPRVSLYGEKMELLSYIETRRDPNPPISNNRIDVRLPLDLPTKFEVPHLHSLKSKLQWLEGLMDTDGTVANNGTNQSLQCTSIHKDFLFRIKLMLQTIGINSKVVDAHEAGQNFLPDGKGGSKLYNTKKSWRLLISSSGLYKLLNLGFSPKRLKVDKRLPNRNAEQFIKVVSVEECEPEDTYCFTEPKKGMGVFNGILTGNCLEITLPTSPIKHIDHGLEDGAEISLCTLAAYNWGKLKSPEDFKRLAPVVVRFLDALLDYQDYPVRAAEESTKARRPLGIGIIGFAHFLAQRGMYYHQSSMGLVDEYAEAMAYYTTMASLELAKERGACAWSNDTMYSEGWTPNISRYAELDKMLPHRERYDWNKLRNSLKTYGIRNSTLFAAMPSETSSQCSNEPNGFEPPRKAVVSKKSKSGILKQVVPNLNELKNAYDWVWQQKTPEGYLQVTAVLQKYIDQAMSINTSYNPANFPDEKIGARQILKDILYAYKLGHKTLYYNNTKKPGEDDIEFADDGCAGGACKI